MCGSLAVRRAAFVRATRGKLEEVEAVDAAELDVRQVVEGALNATVGLVDYEKAKVEDMYDFSKDTAKGQ